MKRLDASAPGFREEFERLIRRRESVSPEVVKAVSEILARVRIEGDAAVEEYSKKYDKCGFGEVGRETLEEAAEGLDAKLLTALGICADRVREQAERELPRRVPEATDEIGVTLGRRFLPVRRAGLYVPGGRASYPSSLIMAAVPARVAGVEELVVASPIDPAAPEARAVMAAAHLMDVNRFFTVGGAHAVAAMAYGTKRVPKVDVIVGPGNVYVSEAKRQLFGVVNIEGIAGPTEIVIIADETLPPISAAADLMAQAEHGPDSRCLLLTPDASYAQKVLARIDALLEKTARRAIIEQSLGDFGAVIIVRDFDEAASLADAYAPEHLLLACAESDRLLAKIRNAGAVFIGPDAPEALGDYVAGSNHILPTAGTARFFSPVSPMTFMRSTNVIRATREALEKLAPSAVILAESEGLDAHALSIRVRLS